MDTLHHFHRFVFSIYSNYFTFSWADAGDTQISPGRCLNQSHVCVRVCVCARVCVCVFSHWPVRWGETWLWTDLHEHGTRHLHLRLQRRIQAQRGREELRTSVRPSPQIHTFDQTSWRLEWKGCFRAGVSNSSPPGPLLCISEMFPFFSHLNQMNGLPSAPHPGLCKSVNEPFMWIGRWSRETSQTWRTRALRDLGVEDSCFRVYGSILE